MPIFIKSEEVVGNMTAPLCEYKFRSGETCGEKCGEDVYETPPYHICRVYIENGRERYREEEYEPPPYCILHLELPIEVDPQYDKIKSAKDDKVQEKIDPKNPDFNFEGAKIYSIDLSRRKGIIDLNFMDATIKGDARFKNATIERSAVFDNAMIKGDAWFENATVERWAVFDNATIGGSASFENATIEEWAVFDNATIGGSVRFKNVKIKGVASFENAKIEWSSSFDNAAIKGKVRFDKTTIKGDVSFDNATLEGESFTCHTAEIIGGLSFEKTLFASLKSQEEACRKAKQAWDKLGDRKTADDYFYRELVAKRKQKNRFMRYLEYVPAQVIFGYGVHPNGCSVFSHCLSLRSDSSTRQ